MAEFARSFPGESLFTWKQLYEAALLQIDRDKLVMQIAEARRAILENANQRSIKRVICAGAVISGAVVVS